MALELFNVIADQASARVRRYIEKHGLLGQVRFRNLYYPEVAADFAARGGKRPPALWDGERLIEGEAEILAALQGLAGNGRA